MRQVVKPMLVEFERLVESSRIMKLQVFCYVNGGNNPENIRICSKSSDLSSAHWGNDGVVSKFFPSMNIGEVDFYGRHLDCGDGVSQRNAGVRVGGRVEYDGAVIALSSLNPTDEFALVVGLLKCRRHAALVGLILHMRFNVSQRCPSVCFGFALAEQVQVGAVEEEYFHSRSTGPP